MRPSNGLSTVIRAARSYSICLGQSRHKLSPISAVFLAGLLALAGNPAHAHVEYYDLNQGYQIADLTAVGKLASQAEYGASYLQDLPLNNSAYWNSTYQSYAGGGVFSNVVYSTDSGSAIVDVSDVSDFGWGNGAAATLGDSHKVDFFNFRLAQDSIVHLSWVVSSGNTYLNSGFSLYRGFEVYQGHDDTVTDPLNPVQTPSFTPIQNAMDTGLVTDIQGIVSPFRNTLNTDVARYVGQYNSLGGWSQANAAGNWSAVEFIQAVDDKHTRTSTNANNVTESLSIALAAGNYTVAASGALITGTNSFNLSNLDGRLEFTYSPVPVPAGIWLFLSAMGGLFALRSKKPRY